VDSDQVEASQPNIIDQAEVPVDPTTVDGVALGGVVESDTFLFSLVMTSGAGTQTVSNN